MQGINFVDKILAILDISILVRSYLKCDYKKDNFSEIDRK